MPSVISGDANVSATEFGYLDGVTSSLQSQIDAKLPLAGGKILQIVRATDTTQRSTTSTSYVDVTGMSVTITPQKSDSAVLIIATGTVVNQNATNNTFTGRLQITDSSNNGIAGAQDNDIGIYNVTRTGAGGSTTSIALIAYATPATTSATTYKLRFRSTDSNNTVYLNNNQATGTMYAIEVSA